MTKTLPSIYNLSIENMKQKIEFYDSINLHSLAVVEPKKLMQSVKLSYARYYFFMEKGIKIDETNYAQLFREQSRFEKRYGITKKELLEKYPYEPEQSSKDSGAETKSTQELGEESKTTQLDVNGIDQMCKKMMDRVKEVKSKKKNEIENN